ncbi:PREDICTED: uncharacterized protein LOC104727769 [Camelina sativa]|uniref:S-protein homolog n=1 Tax=Camelina sativa TaxID=90675 RepID=A0ABM0URR6_CAMSA|nr:PREDICTED: uncharacterized protein LOC104727769 [Camelina sativa]
MCRLSAFHFIFSVTFIVFFFGGLCEASRHVNVDIINDIGPKLQLGLYCKSKDKDLGAHYLAPHQHWGFQAKLNFWETSLFFCHFQWARGSQSKWFDIFDANRDYRLGICQDNPCVWSIRPKGPCRLLKGKEKCFPWNPAT